MFVPTPVPTFVPMFRARILSTCILASGAFLAAPSWAARCTDPAAIATLRAEVDAQCDCAHAATRSIYLRCVRAATSAAVSAGRVSSACASEARKCSSKSTCGQAGAVVCLTPSTRQTRCTVKKSAALCTRSASSCVSPAMFCCDSALGCGGPTTSTTTRPATTSTTATTSTSRPSTTTTTLPRCGNGTIDPGEACDPPGATTCPGSAGGAFLRCNADCTCPSPAPPTCGNGTLEPGETCDPPGSVVCPGSTGGAFVACPGNCVCPATSSTTTTTFTTTTTTTSTTSTLPKPLVCTDPTLRLPPLAKVPVTIGVGTTNCGGAALNPPPSAPFSGELDGAGTAKLSDLGTGCLYQGSGANRLIPGARLPDGSKLIVNVAGLHGLDVVLGPSAGTGRNDCTLPAGPGRHCVNGGTGTDGHGLCAADADCGDGAPGRCALDANCLFGPPLPLPVPSRPIFSACVVNAFDQGACGDMDLLAGTATFSAGVSARAYLTGDATAPCPRCVAGRCDGGKNAGGTCTPVGSAGTSSDCPPDESTFAGTIPVVLQGGSTEPLALAAASGLLCPGQASPGAFGLPAVQRVATHGSRLSLLGLLSNQAAMTVAAPFCINPTGNPAIDGLAGLPGPGVFSIPAKVDLKELLLLGLPIHLPLL